jgi:modulator of FtsH protease HflC
MNRLLVLIVVLVVLGVTAAETVQSVEQGSVAVMQRGEQGAELLGPGLHLVAPPPFASIARFDTRLQSLALAGPLQLPSADHADLLVSPSLIYRIDDPLKFYAATHGDADKGTQRITEALKRALGDALARHTLADVVAHQDALSAAALGVVQADVEAFGVQATDLHLVRVDLPETAAEAVYKRMRADQEQQASAVRASGAAKVDQVRAAAAREQQAVRDDTNRSVQAVKGEGDAQAATLLASATRRDPQFYSFFASLEAYRNSIHPGDVIVVGPDSPFYRFMRDPAGTATPAPVPTPRKP